MSGMDLSPTEDEPMEGLSTVQLLGFAFSVTFGIDGERGEKMAQGVLATLKTIPIEIIMRDLGMEPVAYFSNPGRGGTAWVKAR